MRHHLAAYTYTQKNDFNFYSHNLIQYNSYNITVQHLIYKFFYQHGNTFTNIDFRPLLL